MKPRKFSHSAIYLALMANLAVVGSVYAAEPPDAPLAEEKGSLHEKNNREDENRQKITGRHIHNEDAKSELIKLENVTLTIENSNITMNSTQYSGPVVSVLDKSDVTFEKVTMTVNSTNAQGITVDKSTLNLLNSTVVTHYDNSGQAIQGNDIYESYANLFLGNVSFSSIKNSELIYDGKSASLALVDASDLQSENSTFIVKGEKSAAIGVKRGGSATFNNSTIINEHKDSYIGAISSTGTAERNDNANDLSFENSTLTSVSNGFYFDKYSDNKVEVKLDNSTSLTVANEVFVKPEVIYDPSKSEVFREKFNGSSKIDFSVSNGSKVTGAVNEFQGSTISFELIGSNWNMTNNSNVSSLHLTKEANINFTENGGLKTLTVGKLDEGDGTFNLRSDLANNTSDKVVVTNVAAGHYTLNVKDVYSGKKETTPENKATVFEAKPKIDHNKPLPLTVKLGGEGYVDAGAYRYRLHEEKVGEAKHWVLSNENKEKNPTYVPPKKDEKPQGDVKKPEVPNVVPPKAEDKPNADAPKVVPPAKPQDPMVKPQEPKKDAPKVVPPAKPQDPMVKPQEPKKDAPKVVPPAKPQDPMVKPQEPKKDAPKVVPPAKPKDPMVKPQAPKANKPMLNLNDEANAVLSLRQAQAMLLNAEIAGIHQRLGETKADNAGVWVRTLNQRDEFKAQMVSDRSQSSGAKQDVSGVQVGVDKRVTDHATIGAFVGASRSDVDFNGEFKDVTVRSKSAGLYSSYQADNGVYVDGIAKYSHLQSKFATGEKRSYHAYTLSTEVGREYGFGEQWSVTPMAQLGWSTISGNAKEDRLNVLHSKAGVRVAKTIIVSPTFAWKPFVQVSGVYDKLNNSQAHFGGQHFDIAKVGARVESATGLNLSAGNHQFGIQLGTSHGSKVKQPLSLQAGYRYQW
ncbi:hypothetical protein A4G18_02540 [Pasteurellaceae bacterium Pebbles2]|nr:hypothetical protein [Pasteurellaceae bacterium Pebbles2]